MTENPVLAGASRTLSGGAMSTIAGQGALDSIGVIAQSLSPAGSSVGIVADSVPKLVQGVDVEARIVQAMAGYETRMLRVLEGLHGVVLDESTVNDTVARAKGTDLIVSIGSGTLTDLAKAISQRVNVPLVAVQTAASVNGFSDPLSVLIRNGAKRTVPTAWPNVLIIDDDVLLEAPEYLTRSGVGDAVAIWSAPADWYLACALGVDQGPYDDRFIDPVLKSAPGMSRTDASSTQRLTAVVETLTLGGLVIGAAGTTAPLSGCEHLVSHVLDMAALAAGDEHDLHGAQVGVASILASALWDVAINDLSLFERPARSFRPPPDLRERVLRAWNGVDPRGRLGEECWAAVARKVHRWDAAQGAVEKFFDDRAKHMEKLTALAGDPARPASVLDAWNAAMRFQDLAPSVSEQRARWALAALPFMRDRMTLADLILFAGLWDERLFDRVFERAASVGGGL